MLQGMDGFQRKELKRMLKWVRKNLQVDGGLIQPDVGRCRRSLERGAECTAGRQRAGRGQFLDVLRIEKASWQLLQEKCQSIDVLIGVSSFFANYMAQRLKVPAGVCGWLITVST